MQIPLFLLRRGLFGFMDAEDEPRGLFSFFDGDPEEKGASRADGSADAPADRSAPQEATMPWPEGDPVQESWLDYARQQAQLALREIATLGTGEITRNPVTGEIYFTRHLKRVGDRMSDIATQVPLGPGPVRGPTLRIAPAPVTTLSRSEPVFLFGGPQAKTVEDQVYRLPPGDDSEEDEETDPCTEQYDEEMQECDERYSFDADVFRGCAARAATRLDQCRRGLPRRLWMRRWSDADVDGGWRPPRRPRGRKP